MEQKITIFESNLTDGVMSRNKKFYQEGTSEEKIDQIFLQTRLNLGKKYGFDGKKVFQAKQKTATNGIVYPDGKYIALTENNMHKEDYWYEPLPADILIISNKYKNIVVGNQCADCPIIIAEDRKKGVTALSHCGAAYIDRLLPYQTIEALKKEYNSNSEDIYVYISSNAKKDHFIYDTYPVWAKNKEVWQDCIETYDNKYRIDMEKAILKQLEKQNITNITINPRDTITDENLASHYCEIRGNKNKTGQNFVGFYYH